MGTFVTSNTALPTPKLDDPTNPPRGLPYELDAADINSLWTAADDLRKHTIGFFSVKEYGAIGDGVTDDTGAIKNAIDAAYASTASAITLYFPAGKYRITENGVLSRNTGAARRAIHFRGDGFNASQLFLEPQSAVDIWFFQSTDSLQFATFSDLDFESQGSNQVNANLMNLTSTTGTEQGHRFMRCSIGVFTRLNKVLLLQGTTNCDTIIFDSCRIKSIFQYVTRWENQQAVNIEFLNCNVENIQGDVFEVGTQGGGNAQIIGGSFIWGYDITTDHYLVDVVGSANLQHQMTFVGTRFEDRSVHGILLRKTGNTGAFDLTFVGCDMLASSDGLANYNVASIDAGTTLSFHNCMLPKSWGYTIANTSSGVWTQRNPGTIRWTACAVPGDLASRVTVSSTYGYATARSCWPRLNDGSLFASPEGDLGTVVDFDKGWQNATRGTTSPTEKIAVLKSAGVAWPRTAGADGTPSTVRESTVRVPAGSLITGFRVFKPASGALTAAYQLAIGNGDKTTTYVTSTLAQYKDAHVIDVRLAPNVYINVGVLDNTQTVRLFAPSGGNASNQIGLTGELALVFYI